MKKACKLLFGLIVVSVIGVLAAAAYWQVNLPDSYSLVEGGSITLPGNVKAVFSEKPVFGPDDDEPEECTAELVLPLGVSVKTVSVRLVDRKIVTVSGKPFGIKMFTDGLMVVGMSDFAADGARTNPGKKAGIEVGDILISLDGINLVSNEQMGELVAGCQGKKMLLLYLREGETQKTWIEPVLSSADGKYHIGIWVRDSSAGVGTITFYDEEENLFSGLGHAVCDVDTGDILSLSSGEAVEAVIVGCTPSSSGYPGELKGQFITDREFGSLIANTPCGIFGVMNDGYFCNGQRLPVALSHEVHTGGATILTTIDGSEPKEYDIVIEKILRGNNTQAQNMVIRIVDEALLQRTGGIVQGMSGSPILQDGMLIGAVTHVFVNDPSRGYGIFAENILLKEENLVDYQKKAA